MNIICIIQARIGSTRLPGKVLKEIAGKTVLEHTVDRIRRISNIDDIVVATTTTDMDNSIVEECKRIGVKYFRGSERDVLSRYYHCANEFNASDIVRVTSDCPLIDSSVTKNIVQFYIDNSEKYDYVSNTIDRTYPRGLDTEVFSFIALEKAFFEANSPRDREHVTPYIWDNPNIFRIYKYKSEEDNSGLRWTLDTEEDFKLIFKIYEYFKQKKYFGLDDILKLIELKPELKYINHFIEQKKID